jgi:hypothetical protein
VEFEKTFNAPTYYLLRMIMNKSLVLAALLAAVALSACGKKEEVAAPVAEAASAVMAPVAAEVASAVDTAASAAADVAAAGASAVEAVASEVK